MRKGSYNGSDTQRITNKTITVGSNFRFENLERLNTIVGEVSERNNKQISMKAGKADMSDKVLDLIKNRIKTNCDKLYENYDQNKKMILKQIQQVETNMLSENAISKGFQNVIKEKSNFDKTKSQLQQKQKKLKKLNQIRDQLKENSTESKQLTQIISQKCNLIQSLQCYKEVLDYQTAVLNNMKSDRRTVKLFLKQKYDKMLADQQFKKQRNKKLQTINHNKKTNLKKIEQALKKQEHCEIPQHLAGELQRKLQEYEGKVIYQNIVKHENIISDELRRQTEIEDARQKEESRKARLLKQKEQFKQYELAYNFYLIKQQQEEKIKKICGVSSLSQIVNNSLQSDLENLQIIKRETQCAIAEIKTQNKAIQEQISNILTGKEEYSQQDLLKTEQEYVKAEKQLKTLEINSQKKYDLLNEWHGLVQMMCRKQVSKTQIGSALKQVLDLLVNTQNCTNRAKFSLQENNYYSENERVSSKFKKLREEYESECSIIDKSMM